MFLHVLTHMTAFIRSSNWHRRWTYGPGYRRVRINYGYVRNITCDT